MSADAQLLEQLRVQAAEHHGHTAVVERLRAVAEQLRAEQAEAAAAGAKEKQVSWLLGI